MEDTNPSAMSDAELLRQYSRSQSEDAFRALIDQYVNMVYSSCWRQLRDRHLAEDATQAVFMLLSQKAGAMRHSNLAGWLLTTAHYTCAKIRKMELRRHRRETAVAMEKTRDSGSENNELLAMLDDGLSRLRASDREAIALRYLQGQSLHQVGQALGISEEAARKRVDRCVEKLRSYFARKGITTSAGALPAILDQQTQAAALTHEAQASITSGILNACHGGAGAAPAIVALAKGTNIMMQLTRLKMATFALLITLAVVTAGWWSAKQVLADGANPPPANSAAAPAALQSDEDKYQACRQVLVSIIDAHDRGDAAAFRSQLYFPISADPRLVRSMPLIVDVDLAIYRLQKTAIARFGAHAMGLNFYSGNTVFTLEDILTRVERKDAQISGDTVIFNPSPSFLGQGVWPRGAVYFHNADGVWKFDVPRTLRFQFRFHRRVPIQGETEEQTEFAAEKAIVDAANAIADDTEHGKLASAGELQRRLDGAIVGLAMVFSDFSVDAGPK
ncbi:MAG: sigma-70 family RNA polymerase sigma factor [Tepidisphaeraceae bacterium]|jgi:RNA polymerase sigma factor (sigma-70 family)